MGAGRGPGRRRPRLAAVLWLTGFLLLAAALGALRTDAVPIVVPDRVAPALSGAMATLLAIGLAVRSGGRPLLPGLVVAALTVLATVTCWPVLLAGGAAGTALLAACLAMMATAPASTVRAAVLEVVGALVLATLSGLAVAGFGQKLDQERFGYVVLFGALVAAFLLVYRLGAGLHGVGRRGYTVVIGGLVLLVVALAYSEALGRWGSPQLIDELDTVRRSVREALHAVPHPIETVLGVPALAWGVFMRARRRQGWWVCAFGVAATAPATTRFLEYGVQTTTTVLGAVYSVVLGLVLALVVIRLDQALSGGRGRRARRSEEAAALRPEPGRTRPLS